MSKTKKCKTCYGTGHIAPLHRDSCEPGNICLVCDGRGRVKRTGSKKKNAL